MLLDVARLHVKELGQFQTSQVTNAEATALGYFPNRIISSRS